MPARASSAGAEISINSGFRSRAARRGPAAGDKAWPAPPGTARAGGHSRSGPRSGRLGGAWLVLKSTIRTSRSVTTRRSICPDTSAGRPPGRSSRPTIETSARLPGANTGAKRGIRDQGQRACRPAPAVLPRSSRRRCGPDRPARRRGGARRRYRAAIAAAGAPACRAAGRQARCMQRLGRPTWWLSLVRRVGWPQHRLSADGSGGAGCRAASDGSTTGAGAAAGQQRRSGSGVAASSGRE